MTVEQFLTYLDNAKAGIWVKLKTVALGATADTAAPGNHTHAAPAWGDVTGKPSSFAPVAHAASHATGGADAVTPASIGAATSVALAGEASTARAAEATNATAISAETARAEAAEATKASSADLSTETARATAAEALKAPLATPVVAESSDARTLALGDANSIVRCSSASAVTVTVPTSASVAFPVGTTILVRQAGAGQVTLVPAAGVTLNTSGTLKTRKQHATIALTKIGEDEWDVTGERALS